MTDPNDSGILRIGPLDLSKKQRPPDQPGECSVCFTDLPAEQAVAGYCNGPCCIPEIEGMSFDSWTGYLLERFSLPFCGCGTEQEFEFLRLGLERIAGFRALLKNRDEWDARYKAWSDETRKLLGLGEQYLYHTLSEMRPPLTEHGGSVPGWLTEDGKDLLRIMQLTGVGATS